MKNKKIKQVLDIVTFIIALLLIVIIGIMFRNNMFKNPKTIVRTVEKYGPFGIIVFILIQIVQVILPIIPGGISNIAGVLLFGGFKGFIVNYIGVVVGSIICFLLSRKFGIKLVKTLFKEKTVDKYTKYINNEKFSIFFLITILLPFFPDDLLCYIAGLSNIKTKKFILIITLGKPLSLLFYSIFINKLI
ncbi:MAG: TVP38/TMEM64 family protein [Bacilli bacterium]|nr:TVP38/TMEM64 family protein [Bacilli bacterium]